MRQTLFGCSSLAVVVALASCHSYSVIEETFPADPISRRTLKAPRSLAPAVTLTEHGNLRFILPQACEMQVYRREQSHEITTITPNLATVIVGMIIGSVGAVVLAAGLATDDSPSTFGGGAAIAIGAPLVIAPFVGNKSERKRTGTAEFRSTIREELCGELPLEAESGVVTFRDVRVAGQIDDKGVFTIPVFHFIDAFAFDRVRGEASAMVNTVPEPIDMIIDARKLGPAAEGFFRSLEIDASIQKLESVPTLSGDKFAIVLDRGDPYPIALVSATIRNDGPGTAWRVRARLDSAIPELRSRYLYIGRLGPGQSADPVLAIPLADFTIDLRSADLTLTLLDAHKTAPTTPLSQPRISSN